LEPVEPVERAGLRKVILGCCGTRFFATLRMTKANTLLLSYFDKALIGGCISAYAKARPITDTFDPAS
jgi:hypothetical protein